MRRRRVLFHGSARRWVTAIVHHVHIVRSPSGRTDLVSGMDDARVPPFTGTPGKDPRLGSRAPGGWSHFCRNRLRTVGGVRGIFMRIKVFTWKVGRFAPEVRPNFAPRNALKRKGLKHSADLSFPASPHHVCTPQKEDGPARRSNVSLSQIAVSAYNTDSTSV